MAVLGALVMYIVSMAALFRLRMRRAQTRLTVPRAVLSGVPTIADLWCGLPGRGWCVSPWSALFWRCGAGLPDFYLTSGQRDAAPLDAMPRHTDGMNLAGASAGRTATGFTLICAVM
jgi:hypothetical protein